MSWAHTFELPGVPPNWDNVRLNKQVEQGQRRDWRRLAVMIGLSERRRARVPAAGREEPRRQVTITLHRVKELDVDGAYVSCKPILDGLKGITGGLGMDSIGAGWIYDDRARHCLYEVRQVPVKDERHQKVVITVEQP